MTRHFVGRPELHTLRQEWAIAKAALQTEHDAQMVSLDDRFKEKLVELGLTTEEIRIESLAVVEETWPSRRDFNGLEEDESPD